MHFRESSINQLIRQGDPMVNLDVLSEISAIQMAGEPDVVLEMIESFLKSSKWKVDQIEDLFQCGSYVEIEKVAHGLKTSANVVGALTLGRICQRLEKIEIETNPQWLVEAMRVAYNTSIKMLTEYKENRESSLRGVPVGRDVDG